MRMVNRRGLSRCSHCNNVALQSRGQGYRKGRAAWRKHFTINDGENMTDEMMSEDLPRRGLPTCLKVIGMLSVLAALLLLVFLGLSPSAEERLDWAERSLEQQQYARCLANLDHIGRDELTGEAHAKGMYLTYRCLSGLDHVEDAEKVRQKLLLTYPETEFGELASAMR